MTFLVRRPTDSDIMAMAELGAACQADPELHVPIVSTDAQSIATDIGELEDLATTSAVAVSEADGAIIGWLIGEIDLEIGRVWLWGPFVDPGEPDLQIWADIADRLYAEVVGLLPPEISQQEVCADDRSERFREWCERHRLDRNTASVLLRRDRSPSSAPSSARAVVDPRVRPLGHEDHGAVKALHDLAFPGTHTTAQALVDADDLRLVIEHDGEVAGYVACEMQSDGSGYVDFLAVSEDHRGMGLGRALVDHACHEMFAADATFAHLTVREDNAAARALYASIGFAEERLATPYRLGFSLD